MSPGSRRGLCVWPIAPSDGDSTHDKKPRVETRGLRGHAATQEKQNAPSSTTKTRYRHVGGRSNPVSPGGCEHA